MLVESFVETTRRLPTDAGVTILIRMETFSKNTLQMHDYMYTEVHVLQESNSKQTDAHANQRYKTKWPITFAIWSLTGARENQVTNKEEDNNQRSHCEDYTID